MSTESRERRFEHLTRTDAVRSDLRVRSIRAVGFTAAAGFGDILLRFASTAVLARMLAPDHFGVVMMVMAVTAIADQFRDLGLSTATVQKQTISHREVSNLFWINCGIGVLMTLVVAAAAPLIAAYYQDNRLIPITFALSITFALNGLIVQHQALLARTLRLGTNAWIRLLSSVVSTVLAIVLAWQGFGYWALVWREVARSLILAGGVWVCIPWIPDLPSRAASVRGLLRFGVPLSAANIVLTIGAGADRFLLGRFWSAAAVGIYRQGYQLLTAPLDQLLAPAFQVTQPALSLLQGDAAKFRAFYSKLLICVCAVTMPLSLFVAVAADEVVMVVLGADWVATAPIVAVLGIGGFLRQPVGSSAHLLIARGESASYLRLTVLQTVTATVFMCAGVYWGPLGIAVADVAATYVLIAPRLHYSFRGSPLSIATFFVTIARPAIASMTMATVLLLMHDPLSRYGPSAFLMIGGPFAVLLFLAIWSLLPGGAAELTALVSDVRAALRKRRDQPAADHPVPVTTGA
jgi:polysaccharide transporter, PST family